MHLHRLSEHGRDALPAPGMRLPGIGAAIVIGMLTLTSRRPVRQGAAGTPQGPSETVLLGGQGSRRAHRGAWLGGSLALPGGTVRGPLALPALPRLHLLLRDRRERLHDAAAADQGLDLVELGG